MIVFNVTGVVEMGVRNAIKGDGLSQNATLWGGGVQIQIVSTQFTQPTLRYIVAMNVHLKMHD